MNEMNEISASDYPEISDRDYKSAFPLSMTQDYLEGYRRVIQQQGREIAFLIEAILKQKLEAMEKESFPEKVIVLKQIPREQAKQEIEELFASGRTLYFSDIAEELRLDLELVVNICKELEKEGKIGIDEDAIRSRG